MCDGYCEFDVDSKLHHLLIEYKFDEDMSSKAFSSESLSADPAYMKRFEDNGQTLPSVVLVADKNECFVIHPMVYELDFLKK